MGLLLEYLLVIGLVSRNKINGIVWKGYFEGALQFTSHVILRFILEKYKCSRYKFHLNYIISCNNFDALSRPIILNDNVQFI